MSNRVTTILVVLLLLAGAALYYEGFRPQGATPPQETAAAIEERSKPRLFEVDAAQVERIVLRANNTQRVSLRQGEEWTGPAPALVAEFLRDLSTLRLLSELDAGPDDLKQFGLDPPRGVVELQLRGQAQALQMEIGTRNPSTTGVYVRLQGSRLGVAGALIEWEIQRLFQKLVTDHAV